MSTGRKIYISRDKREIDGDWPKIQMWLNKPSKTKMDKSFIYTSGTWIGLISLETAAMMGSDFELKPGEYKPVMMAVVK